MHLKSLTSIAKVKKLTLEKFLKDNIVGCEFSIGAFKAFFKINDKSKYEFDSTKLHLPPKCN